MDRDEDRHIIREAPNPTLARIVLASCSNDRPFKTHETFPAIPPQILRETIEYMTTKDLLTFEEGEIVGLSPRGCTIYREPSAWRAIPMDIRARVPYACLQSVIERLERELVFAYGFTYAFAQEEFEPEEHARRQFLYEKISSAAEELLSMPPGQSSRLRGVIDLLVEDVSIRELRTEPETIMGMPRQDSTNVVLYAKREGLDRFGKALLEQMGGTPAAPMYALSLEDRAAYELQGNYENLMYLDRALETVWNVVMSEPGVILAQQR